jgi:hypothetical protein
MLPSCLACGAGVTVEEWCLTNQDDEWYSEEECSSYIPQNITTVNLRTICENNDNTVNCESVRTNNDDLDPNIIVSIVVIGIVVLGFIPICFLMAKDKS